MLIELSFFTFPYISLFSMEAHFFTDQFISNDSRVKNLK